MAGAVPSIDRKEILAAIGAILRRRASQEKLYWRLARPRAGVYAREAGRVLCYRAGAAAAAIIAVALCVFLGTVMGNIGAHGWPPPVRLGPRTINPAVARAIVESAAWTPAFIVLGLILAIIPRPRHWVFRLTILGAGALGYCHRLLSPFPRSSIASAITERSAAFVASLPLWQLTSASTVGVALAMVVTAALAGYLSYQFSYRFAKRSTGRIPRRPVSHYHSTFVGPAMLHRLAAVSVTAALLVACVWIAESARAPLPGVRYGAVLFGYSHPSSVTWALAALIVAYAVCMPRPNGSQWLFIVLFLGLTVYAFLPHVYSIRMPGAIPVADPGSFWALVIAYLCVTGFGYTLVAALLDWR